MGRGRDVERMVGASSPVSTMSTNDDANDDAHDDAREERDGEHRGWVVGFSLARAREGADKQRLTQVGVSKTVRSAVVVLCEYEYMVADLSLRRVA